jgi:hypothetical protein
MHHKLYDAAQRKDKNFRFSKFYQGDESFRVARQRFWFASRIAHRSHCLPIGVHKVDYWRRLPTVLHFKDSRKYSNAAMRHVPAHASIALQSTRGWERPKAVGRWQVALELGLWRQGGAKWLASASASFAGPRESRTFRSAAEHAPRLPAYLSRSFPPQRSAFPAFLTVTYPRRASHTACLLTEYLHLA